MSPRGFRGPSTLARRIPYPALAVRDRNLAELVRYGSEYGRTKDYLGVGYFPENVDRVRELTTESGFALGRRGQPHPLYQTGGREDQTARGPVSANP